MKNSKQKQNDFRKSDDNSLKEILSKKVSTLVGGILIGGVALLFLLILLIIWLGSK